jgi:DeoR/GlpR family transcriptional regulator of sugar metabolism
MARSKKTDLAPRRRDRLVELVTERGVARVGELCSALGASPATVRRDLEELEGAGRIRRVHGGAVAVQTRLAEPLFDDKTAIAARQKHRIAQAALKIIASGETVYLDGGSTVLELARLLRERSDLTVVTNSLRAALELGGKGPRLILVGGELRRRSQTLVGPLSGATLGELGFDKAFMGTMGVDLEKGLTTSDPNEAHTKKAAMGRSNQVILLADGSKAGKVSFARAGEVTDVQVLVTDKGIDGGFARALAKRGVRVVRV